jgi:glycosyltransferase involved in cell wall biosynthesis
MNERAPLVSVVIIFLDAGRFIREAIESVLEQTYQRWELLLVDDGSSDESTAIAREYAQRMPDQVRYLTHPGRENRGMSASRNLGIRHAAGTLVALLDADDLWLPEKLDRQVAILAAHPEVAMVYGPTQWWYGWTGMPGDEARDFIHDLGVTPDSVVEPPDLLLALLRDEGIAPCTCSMLIRRDILVEVGAFEESFRGLYEDQALCAKVCLRWPVFAAGECWYRYRQHPDSACAVAERTGTRQGTRLVFLDWLARWLGEQGHGHDEVRRAIERERERLRASPPGRSPLAVLGSITRVAGERARLVSRRARTWWGAIRRLD